MPRRKARETAMQILYEIELGKNEARNVFERTVNKKKLHQQDIDFIRELVYGTLDNVQVLDGIISGLSRQWNIGRLAVVDKSLIRMALYEMLYLDEIPVNVSINEAIELAKVYSGKDSPKFINGILGKVARDPSLYPRPENRDPD